MKTRKHTPAVVFDPQEYEPRWHDAWEQQQLFWHTADQIDESKEKMYLLFAFAYPSGTGLHVGHVESKTALDILARYYRMNGKQVFFPVGWDAFGLPAENYAIKTGTPPAQTTKQAIDTFRKQIKRLGISYDWSTELATCHPGYYQWTQWLFVQLYNAGLAYQGTGMVNWCPSCQTVLANEQVVEGACERCGAEVVQKEMKQWYFKITQYQDELISGLDQVDWPEPTKQQQLHWIGRSEGVKISFEIKNSTQHLDCFTTRVDTVFGVTFVAVSPEKFVELGLLNKVARSKQRAVKAYIDQASHKTEEQRKIGEKDKTGVDTGLKVINPVNQVEVPIFVADYVLAGYGTGAVMGVPAHDERDRLFARMHNLPITQVIVVNGQTWAEDAPAVSDYGTLINSGKFNNLSSQEAMDHIPAAFAQSMEVTTTYKLRDWLISRQRYWGAPIPIIYDPDGQPHLVDANNLPWMLPTDVDFKPTGESPLASSVEFQQRTERYAADQFAELIDQKGWDKSGKGWRPEYDTMDTFVDSSWYYLRYGDARNEQQFASREQLQRWQPIDFYMIGPEHIVLHLLYSRFFTKFLRDQNYLQFDEPFMKMRHQGMILGPDGRKMSKSKGNVISPDDIIDKFGADTLRVYEMFMGPIEADKPWDVRAVVGIYKFLARVHTLVMHSVVNHRKHTQSDVQLLKKLHKTIDKVGHDIPRLKFNTAIAMIMECVNVWESIEEDKRAMDDSSTLAFVSLLAPFAPFLAEELYQKVMGNKSLVSVHQTAWPQPIASYLKDESKVIPVQINGKVRARIEIPSLELHDTPQVLARAKADVVVAKWLSQGSLVREIYVPERIINFVTSS